jgi:hypothetical protein
MVSPAALAWNNHAWTEPHYWKRGIRHLVVHTSTGALAFADDEVPTRRQQREQRERDEEYATSPPTKTKRRMPPPRTHRSASPARDRRPGHARRGSCRRTNRTRDEIDDIDDILRR